MADREKRVVWSEALDVDSEGYTVTLQVSVYYDKGGANMFTYRNDTRGYYIGVEIDRTKTGPKMVSHKFGLFDGQRLKRNIQVAARFSEKNLVARAKDVGDGVWGDLVDSMKASVLEKYQAERAKQTQAS